MSENNNNNYIQRLVAVLLFVLVLGAGVSFSTKNDPPSVEASAAMHNVSGWAWNGDNMNDADATTNGGIGWINFNCQDSSGSSPYNDCSSNYGVNIETAAGANLGLFSGYAFAGSNSATDPGFGWISFNNGVLGGTNDLAGCPGAINGTSAVCEARADIANPGNIPITGWARFCMHSAGAPNGCTGAGTGDMGWISLRGMDQSNANNYGVSINRSTGFLEGYAWSPDYGWIDFHPFIDKGVLFSGLVLDATLDAYNVGTSVQNTRPLYNASFDLKWTSTGGATSCTATQGTNWAGNKTPVAAGTETNPGVDRPTVFAIECFRAAETTGLKTVNIIPKAFDLFVTPGTFNYDLQANGISTPANQPTYTIRANKVGSYPAGTVLNLSVVSNSPIPGVTIHQPSPSTITANNTDTATFVLDISGLAVAGNYPLRVTATDGVGNSETVTVFLNTSGVNKDAPKVEFKDL